MMEHEIKHQNAIRRHGVLKTFILVKTFIDCNGSSGSKKYTNERS